MYGKVTWIKLIKTSPKYSRFQDLQAKGIICEIFFKDINIFPFVHLIVNYITLTFMQSPLADSEGGGGGRDVRPPPPKKREKTPNKHKKIKGRRKKTERERREIQFLRLNLS